jgi:uncharacterized membrane-anchored protein
MLNEATSLPLNSFFDWLEARRKQVVMAAIIFQLALLGWMIVTNLTPILTGKTILVRVVPVDPRDLFRGEYVILSYEFSRVPTDTPGIRWDDLPSGQAVYVTMVPDADDKHWKAGTFSAAPPESGIYLEGKISGNGWAEYGIESFFVQEGQGKAYEDAVRHRKLWAEIAVSGSGKAKLKKLVVE